MAVKTVSTRDKKLFQQLIYQMAQIPTLQLADRADDLDALPDLRRNIKGLLTRLLETAREVTGPKTTAVFDFDRLSAIIEGVRLESTIIAPATLLRVWVLYKEAFDDRHREVYLELQPSLYFKPHSDLE